jgi:hypothetical protein
LVHEEVSDIFSAMAPFTITRFELRWKSHLATMIIIAVRRTQSSWAIVSDEHANRYCIHAPFVLTRWYFQMKSVVWSPFLLKVLKLFDVLWSIYRERNADRMLGLS